MFNVLGLFSFPLIIGVFWLINCIKILNEYERGVVFRLGRMVASRWGRACG